MLAVEMWCCCHGPYMGCMSWRLHTNPAGSLAWCEAAAESSTAEVVKSISASCRCHHACGSWQAAHGLHVAAHSGQSSSLLLTLAKSEAHHTVLSFHDKYRSVCSYSTDP